MALFGVATVSPAAPSEPVAGSPETSLRPAGSTKRSSKSTHRASEFLLKLQKTPEYRVFWVALMLFYLVMMVIVALLGLGYLFMATNKMETVRRVYHMPSQGFLLAVAGLKFAVAAIYGAGAHQMLSLSFREKRLVLRRQYKSIRFPRTGFGHELVLKVYGALFSRRGLFGPESPYFEWLFLLRELLEIVSQTYQGYRLSLLVPKRWLNALSTVLILANCWSTPLLHVALHRQSVSVRRATCLVVDILLDLASAVVLPLVIVVPYFQVYDKTLIGFPDIFTADSAWMMSFDLEAQQVCVTSVFDFVSKEVPVVGIFLSCRGLCGIIQNKTRVDRCLMTAAPVKNPPQPVVESDAATSVLVFQEDTVSTIQVSAGCRMGKRAKRFASRHGQQLGHTFFALWGLAVLSVHLSAHTNSVASEALGCKVPLAPWFTHEISCALEEIDCHAISHATGNGGGGDEMVGGQDNLNQVIRLRLGSFRALDLRGLEFSHCGTLHMPPIVQSFTHLAFIDIFNCTLEDWKVDATVTSATNPHLARVGLVRSNLSGIPEGLLADHLPASLITINLVATNLTSLPMSLATKWRHVQFLNFEHGLLRELPPVILQMRQLSRLALTNNEITSLPSDMSSLSLQVMLFGGNPLTNLPLEIGADSQILWLSFDYTLVNAVPSWLKPRAKQLQSNVLVHGNGTPFCSAQIEAGNGSLGYEVTFFGCRQRNPRASGYFPLEAVTKLRRLA